MSSHGLETSWGGARDGKETYCRLAGIILACRAAVGYYWLCILGVSGRICR